MEAINPDSVTRIRSVMAKLKALSEDVRAPIEERQRAWEKWNDLRSKLPQTPRRRRRRYRTGFAQSAKASTEQNPYDFNKLTPEAQRIIQFFQMIEAILNLFFEKKNRSD